MCCSGCAAVAELINQGGLEAYYRFREVDAPRAANSVSQWSSFDQPAVQQAFLQADSETQREIALHLDNVQCAACAWLIERSLDAAFDQARIEVNPVSGHAVLQWNPRTAVLSDLLAHIEMLGYGVAPLRRDAAGTENRQEKRRFLVRLLVAGLAAMQSMMVAGGFYLSPPGDMPIDIENFLRIVSMLMATPVVLYSAWPFFKGALRDLSQWRTGMDVPIAIAIAAAYSASIVNVFDGQGEIYFDSVCMFVFFLLIGRFMELRARHEVASASNALAASLPAMALREGIGGEPSAIALTDIRAGDVLLVRSGDIIPADGKLLSDTAVVDEALLTGESEPVNRQCDEELLAGAINQGAAVRLRVSRSGNDTYLSGISRLLRRSQAARPRVARLTDRIARHFVAVVLAAAALAYAAWQFIDPAQGFEIVIAVLVVTCPCALALAVPVALTAATGRLAKEGLLTMHPGAIEQLPAVTDVVFDKTGTLTEGRPTVTRIVTASDIDEPTAMAIAAGLEAASNHPLRHAFASPDAWRFDAVREVAGQGLEASHDNATLRLGRPDFVLAATAGQATPDESNSWIVLGRNGKALAWFAIADSLRVDAADTVAALQARGLRVHLLSGDSQPRVQQVANELGIDSWQAGVSPEDKVAFIRARQQAGNNCLMIGDGINDAPVLVAADTSIAMGRAALLAQASAHLLLQGGLSQLVRGLDVGQRTSRIIRQNIAWAIGYNLLALPLAMTGLVTPWMAAIGMSSSSLLVTLNALRLRRTAEVK